VPRCISAGEVEIQSDQMPLNTTRGTYQELKVPKVSKEARMGQEVRQPKYTANHSEVPAIYTVQNCSDFEDAEDIQNEM
jgi:hypothetical protein